jgi:hypothetical protein
MLQVITLASIATVVLTAALLALAAAAQKPVEQPAPSRWAAFVTAPSSSAEVTGQPASYAPTVNLNVMVPLCYSSNERDARDVLTGSAVVAGPVWVGGERGPAEARGDNAEAVVLESHHRPQGRVAPALAAAEVQYRTALDVIA